MPRPKGVKTGLGRGFGSGAGSPKGYRFPDTIAREAKKEAARDYIQQRVVDMLDPLLTAQLANARGIDHFYRRDAKSGQWKRIEDPEEIVQALNSEDRDSYCRIWTKDPSVQAFVALLDRALDRPKEQIIDISVNDVTKRPTEELVAETRALLEKFIA